MHKCLIATILALTACGGSSRVQVAEAQSRKPISESGFIAVKKAFEKAGARVERDMTTPGGRTVRIYLPIRVALEMTKSQAATIAADARSKLGDDAVVYIKGPGGNTLARASSFD